MGKEIEQAKRTHLLFTKQVRYGPPRGIRTLDQRNRNPVLYPAELWAEVQPVYYTTFHSGLQGLSQYFSCENSRLYLL